jgi:hypothetical protein
MSPHDAIRSALRHLDYARLARGLGHLEHAAQKVTDAHQDLLATSARSASWFRAARMLMAECGQIAQALR